MLSLRNFFNKKSIKKKKTESFFDCLLPIDKQNIIQITKQEATLDQITKQVEKKKKLLEVEIRTIQKSTRTTNPIFIKAHNKLRAKYNWYYKWHIWPQHEKIHISTLVLCLMAATFSIYGTFIKDLRPSLAATLSFATKVEYTGTTTTFGVASADFNKDGITDAVTANNGGSTISVFLGTGAGVFAAKTNYATGATPFSIATGDFNRDGNIDIVTANNTNTLSILLGAGNGTFPTHVEYTIGGRGWSVLTADFNRDGITDIATVNYDTSTVSILLGAGNGTFGSKTDFAAGYYPRGATIADFNKDGKIDLAVASGDNNVAVLLGNGSGGFAAQVYYATATNPSSIISGDFNRDGVIDVVTTSEPNNTLSVLLGVGNGTFSAKVDYPVGTSPYSVTIGDFNKDGKIDLATSNMYSANISILLGVGDGTFGAKTDYGTGSYPCSIVSGDFSLDGKDDVINALNGGNISVLLNTTTIPGGGASTFSAKSDKTTGSGAVAIAKGDFNLDGKGDIATANMSNDTVSILIGNGAGDFAAKVDYAVGTSPRSITVAYINADAYPDLAVANYTGTTVSILLNDGDGTFTAGTAVATGAGPMFVTSGDFNRDGKTDLVTGNYDAATVSILIGNGTGGFAAKVDYATGTNPYSVVVSDYNSDGKLDLAVANYGGGTGTTISILTGIGNATAPFFNAKADYTTGTGPISITSADFNSDGKVDLATANYGSGDASILLNSGTGTFPAHVEYTTGTSAYSITPADLNVDGKLDLAVVNYGSNNISTLLGAGNGTFGTAVDYTTGTSPRSVTADDFNRDGRVDLAVANSGDSTASVFLNTIVLSTTKAITAFSIPSQVGNTVIDEGAHTVTAVVPVGTDVSALVATFTTTGSLVEVGATTQVSGTTANNFTSSVTYIVTAEDFSAQNYIVTITNPVSTVTSVSPNAGSTAGGTNVTITGTNFVQGGGLATGGAITTNGAYTVHTFTTGGTLDVPSGRDIEYLIVAGGGAGGYGNTGGGAGAGGFLTGTKSSVATGSYNIVVGNGGTPVASASSQGGSGGNSSIFSNTAIGGGGGGGDQVVGASGGSGGGNGVNQYAAGAPTGTAGQGNNGGKGTYSSPYPAGGGGGKGAVGANTGAGGAGASSSISGSSVAYAGGGAGGNQSSTRLAGGSGVGGYGGSSGGGVATAGTTNRGGGGGGGGGTNFNGGGGGSGIVIVRYLTSVGTSITFGGVAATNVTVVNSTTITATTPAHAAGAVNIVATNPDTTTGTLSNEFTYNAAPTLSGASPSSGSKTGGDAVTLTGTNFYGTPTVTVGGTTATNIVVVNSTTITMTTPAHTVGQVNIVVTNSDTQLTTLTNGFTYTDTYNLASSAGANGSISPDGITNVASGGSQAYTITPSLHYHILDVLVDSISQGAVTTYTFNSVSTSHTISATFTIDTFNITASGGANGSISPNGVTTVNYNGSQTYTIAADLHYHILDVLVDSVSQGAISSYTFNNVAATHTISVTFAIDTYNITASGGANGSVSPNGATSVDYNNSQAYTITPNAHYHIVDVLVDSVSQGTISSYTFNNVSAIHTISATFAIDTYLVSMNKAGSGTGSLDQTTGAFDYGSNLSIIATSDISSSFISWVGCSSVNGNICYLTNLAAQQTITATFDIKTFIVTASKTGSGSGSFSNETTTVNYGSSFSTTLSPDSNSNFISFIVCPIPSVNTCNITNIISDQSVIAQIELKPVINNIINENNQSISAVKTNSSTITINIAPNNTATEMEFSNSLDFLGATYEPIALTKTWTLSSPDINGVKTIYYRVKDQYGNESPISSMTITLDIQAPSAPTNLTVSPGINSISLSWDNPTDADFAKVVIFRSTNPNFVPAIDNNVSHYDEILNNKIGETANGDIRTFVDTNVIDGVVYYYLIKAIDDADNYSPSNPPLITGTSTQSPFEPNSNLIVEKPTEETLEILNIAVKVSETENKTIQATITWETSGSATSEVNYGKTTDYEELSVKDDNLSLFHTIILNNLGFNTTYHFNVISKNINGGLALSTDNNFTTGTVSEERPDEKSALNMFISNLTDQMVMIRDIFIVSAEQVTAAVKNTNLFISNATNISEAAVPAVASSIAVSVATVAAAAAPVANAMTVFSFPEYLKAIFYSILSLSARKKRKDWGKVVEAKTGIPIAQAKIDLIKIEKIQNEEKDLRTVVASTYSEKDGSYAFIADPGQYKIAVEKDMFFLSEEPGFYNSEIITVKNETDSLIVPSIALSMSKNETKKKLHSLQNLTIFEKVIFYVALAFLIVGTLTAISGFLKNPGSTYSIITLCLYPFLWYLSIKSMLKVSPFGQVEDATNHKGVPLALLRIMDPTGNKLIKTAVTNEEGKYKTLIDKGNYKVLISKDGYKQMKPIELLVTKKISSVNKIIELEEE